jgi:hypothetical protein
VAAVSRPLTKAELLSKASELRVSAKATRSEAEIRALSLEHIAGLLEDAAKNGLTIFEDSDILRHKMQPQAAARPPRKVGRPVEVKHRFRSWLEGQGLNVREWAEAHHCAESTVKAWMRPRDEAGRKIPEGMALLIQNEAGKDAKGHWLLPATTETWPNGIKA